VLVGRYSVVEDGIVMRASESDTALAIQRGRVINDDVKVGEDDKHPVFTGQQDGVVCDRVVSRREEMDTDPVIRGIVVDYDVWKRKVIKKQSERGRLRRFSVDSTARESGE